MREPERHVTQAFRDEAVRLVQISGRARREIAEDLRGGLSRLRHWIGAQRGVLRQDREILKRATTFVAEEGSR